MTTNILIGFGGTGAKVVESILHASAAGLGPESLFVGFVDQDQSNGNVSRAKQLLRTLMGTRKLWRSGGAGHRISAPSDLLKTDIKPLTGEDQDELWIPHRTQRVSLSRIFGDLPDDRHLFDLLYEKGSTEQDMELDEGYRGRPHIGAAAITAQVQEDVDFWRALIQLIKNSKTGEPVRLLLAGSVFGGTGAAGFPTIARLIRNRLKQEGIGGNVLVGGVLMLPYFSFDAPETEAGKAGNVAKSEELLLNSKEALKFYHNLFRHEQIFDELYLVGWDRPFNLGYHSAGAGDQKNPALVPELIAALGACRFFHPTYNPADGVANNVFASAREDARRIGWSDLPSPDPQAKDAAFEKLGQLLRFAVAWKRWHGILAAPKGMLAKRFTTDAWYRMQGLDQVDFKKQPPTDEVARLSSYLDNLLEWAATMQVYAERERLEFKLWRIDDLLARTPDFASPQSSVEIHGGLEDHAFGDAFEKLIVEKEAGLGLPNANSLLTNFNTVRVNGDHKGLGRAVAALHQFSTVIG